MQTLQLTKQTIQVSPTAVADAMSRNPITFIAVLNELAKANGGDDLTLQVVGQSLTDEAKLMVAKLYNYEPNQLAEPTAGERIADQQKTYSWLGGVQ